jgi:hypothetical protein
LRTNLGGGGAGLLASSATRAGFLDGATLVHFWARGDIAVESGVDVDQDTRVAGGVSSGKLDSRGRSTATTFDSNLIAGHVELGTAVTTRSVEGNNLSAEEVVTGRDVIRDLDIDETTAVVHVLDTPEVVIARASRRVGSPRVLVNLEPGSRAVSRGSIIDLGQVDHDWTVVGSANGLIRAAAVIGLLVHLNGHGITSLDRALRGGRRCSSVASNIIAADACNGAVARGNTSALSSLIDTIDPELLESGMAHDLLGSKRREDGNLNRLHIGV